MPRTITLHPLSLAMGAAVIGGAFLLASQTLPPAQVVWPPPKALILNLFQEFSPPITVPPGGTYTVITVPPDRWLTLTYALANYSGAGFSWFEFNPTTGTSTQKGYGFPGQVLSGPIGWTFAPGSEVVVATSPHTPPIPADLSGVTLMGYYSRN